MGFFKRFLPLVGVAAFSFSTLCFGQDAEEKKTYEETVKYLSPGGISFTYKNTNAYFGIVEKIFGFVEQQFPKNPQTETFQIVKTAIAGMFNDSGIAGMRGMGNSIIQEPSGEYVLASSAYAPPELQKGILWNIYGQKAHSLDNVLKQLPPTTLLAFYSDVNLSGFHDFILESSKKYGTPEIQEKVTETQNRIQQMGIDLPEVLKSIESITVYAANGGTQVVVPGISEASVFIKVKNTRLFDTLKEQVLKNSPELVQEKEILFPLNPQLSIHIYMDGNYCVTTTNPESAKALLGGNAPNLSSTDAFRQVANGLKLEGNQLFYMAPACASVLETYAAMKNPDSLEMIHKTFEFIGLNQSFLAVAGKTADAYTGICKTKSMLPVLMSEQYAIQFVPITAGMLLPALNSAGEKARRIHCISNMKQLMLCYKMYELDYKGFPNAEGAAAFEILRKNGYLTDPKMYVCSSGKEKCAGQNEPLTENTVSYLYLNLGPEVSLNPDAPILIEKLRNHKTSVNVAFSDGHVEQIQGKFNSITDVVKELAKRNQYDEKMQKLLLEKAAALDKPSTK